MIVDFIQSTDNRTNKIVENNQIPLLNQGFNALTSLGSVYFSLLAIGFLWSFGKAVIARQLVLGLLITGVVIYALKYTFRRKRPEDHIENVISRTSFPSGHSGNAFMTATILSSYLGRSLAFFSLAIIVAASRVYLEDHYLSDVIIGSGIGLVIGQILITV